MPRRKPATPKPNEFYNEALKCKFSLPEPLCMRHVEIYEKARDTARNAGAQFAPSINWVGAVEIIENWECETLPNPKELSPEDLADIHGESLQIVMWVASKVAIYVMEKLFIPKN